jgi:hypothetical protein
MFTLPMSFLDLRSIILAGLVLISTLLTSLGSSAIEAKDMLTVKSFILWPGAMKRSVPPAGAMESSWAYWLEIPLKFAMLMFP